MKHLNFLARYHGVISWINTSFVRVSLAVMMIVVSILFMQTDAAVIPVFMIVIIIFCLFLYVTESDFFQLGIPYGLKCSIVYFVFAGMATWNLFIKGDMVLSVDIPYVSQSMASKQVSAYTNGILKELEDEIDAGNQTVWYTRVYLLDVYDAGGTSPELNHFIEKRRHLNVNRSISEEMRMLKHNVLEYEQQISVKEHALKQLKRTIISFKKDHRNYMDIYVFRYEKFSVDKADMVISHSDIERDIELPNFVGMVLFFIFFIFIAAQASLSVLVIYINENKAYYDEQNNNEDIKKLIK